MRSLARSLLALTFAAAALIPGAAVFVTPAFACTLLTPASAAEFVPTAELIVIGTVTAASSTKLVLEPEAFLKGPASGEPIAFSAAEGDMCPGATLETGDRALIYVFDAVALPWPYINQVYLLESGRATIVERTETEVAVVEQIRSLTGQYAVPAIADGGEGAGINWKSTVLPMGVVLIVVFGIGLVMMRVWHRIDPS